MLEFSDKQCEALVHRMAQSQMGVGDAGCEFGIPSLSHRREERGQPSLDVVTALFGLVFPWDVWLSLFPARQVICLRASGIGTSISKCQIEARGHLADGERGGAAKGRHEAGEHEI